MTGLIFTQPCSQPGSDEVGTNMLLPKVSGNITRNPMPCTAPDSRSQVPRKTATQLMHSANAIASRQPASADSGSVPIRKPSA